MSEAEQPPDHQRHRHREAEAPPGQRDHGGQGSREQDPQHHAGDTQQPAPDGLVESQLDDEEGRQWCEDRSRVVRERERHDVRRDGRQRGLEGPHPAQPDPATSSHEQGRPAPQISDQGPELRPAGSTERDGGWPEKFVLLEDALASARLDLV